MNTNVKRGIALAVCAAGISGFSIFFNKLVLVKGIDPHVYNVIKNGGAAFCLFVLLLLRSGKVSPFHYSKKKLKETMLIGIIGGGIPFILYFEGLRTVSAISANLIHKSMFLWVAVLALPILGEKLKSWQIFGYGLIVAGTVLLGGFDGFRGTTGELLILAATLLWSVEHILVKRFIKSADADSLAWGRMAFGLPILLTYVLMTHRSGIFMTLPSTLWFAAAGSILLLTAYVWTWYQALARAPAVIVTSVLILALPVTTTLTAFFITRTLTPSDILGIIAILTGVISIIVLSRSLRTTTRTELAA